MIVKLKKIFIRWLNSLISCINLCILQEGSQKPLLTYKGTSPIDECYVNLEEVAILCTNIFQALATLIALIYLLNLQYPDKLYQTFTFIEYYLLNFGHNQKLSKKLQGLIKRLEN